MRLIRRLLAVSVLCALVATPAAIAKQYAPPGKAGTSEYAEDIPTAGGNAATPAMGGGNKTAAQIDRLGAGKAGVRKLSKLGSIGAAVALFAQQTAPTNTSATAPTTTSAVTTTAVGGGGSPTHPAAVTQSMLTASGGSAVSGLAHLIGGSDGGGIGIVLPLLLALGAVGAGLLGVLRLRHPRSDAQP